MARVDWRKILEPIFLRELDQLVTMVLPNGRRDGSEWVGIGPDGQEWSINISNTAKRGIFSIWKAGDLGNDQVDFVCRGLFDDDFSRMLTWAIPYFNLDELRGNPVRLRTMAEQSTRAEHERRRRQEQEDAESAAEARIFYNGLHEDPGPAFDYLAARDLPVPRDLVPELRYGSGVPYRIGGENKVLPAMVAAVVNVKLHKITSAHRTYIEPDANGVMRKAKSVHKNKSRAAKGPTHDGIIPLIAPAGQTWSEAVKGVSTVRGDGATAEGIENALSLALVHPGAWCCSHVSLANVVAVAQWFPQAADRIIFAFDRDGGSPNWRKITEKRVEALREAIDAGIHVMVYVAPRSIKDANDRLQMLVRDRGYRPRFSNVPVALDWQAALDETVPITDGDPAARWWKAVTGLPWRQAPAMPLVRLHRGLPPIEVPDQPMPAVMVPLIGDRRGLVGALVAWLAPQGDGWGLAPLMQPIRLLGSQDGVAAMCVGDEGEDGSARLVVGLENAFRFAAFQSPSTLCVLDPAHAVYCAPGVVALGVKAVNIRADVEDETTCWRMLLECAQDRLAQAGIGDLEVLVPSKDFADYATVFADETLGFR